MKSQVSILYIAALFLLLGAGSLQAQEEFKKNQFYVSYGLGGGLSTKSYNSEFSHAIFAGNSNARFIMELDARFFPWKQWGFYADFIIYFGSSNTETTIMNAMEGSGKLSYCEVISDELNTPQGFMGSSSVGAVYRFMRGGWKFSASLGIGLSDYDSSTFAYQYKHPGSNEVDIVELYLRGGESMIITPAFSVARSIGFSGDLYLKLSVPIHLTTQNFYCRRSDAYTGQPLTTELIGKERAGTFIDFTIGIRAKWSKRKKAQSSAEKQ